MASVTPRSVIKAGFAARILPNGQVWIDMLDRRYVLSHRYDAALLVPALTAIQQQFLPALTALHAYLEAPPE